MAVQVVREQARVQRASPTDRAFLAMDTGPVPEQFGVVLRLTDAADLDLAGLRELLSDRVPAIPRLRQRLEPTPIGCGGPVWVDDDFDLRRHVGAVACPPPGDDQALLDTALGLVMAPLPGNLPLWTATLVTGLPHDEAALVLVLHHTLADGLAGLAVLAGLVDEGARHVDAPPARPRPDAGTLARDAVRSRVAAARSLPESARLLRASMSGGGGLHPPRAAECSLVQRTGPRRAVRVARAALTPLRDAAHSLGVTTNDAVVVAVARALGVVLETRGEHVPELVVTVPVAGRRQADGAELGNLVSPMLVPVPTAGDRVEALKSVAATVRAHKQDAAGPPPIALLGWAFRPLARLGGYRAYMNHQHRMHTLVSHLRGPDQVLHLGGRPVVDAVPVAVAEGGNIPVYFEVLSYAGTLTVVAVVDPDHFAEPDLLATTLAAELEAIADLGTT
jgi:WS/DGAT/MGAT family acyltransferase